MANNTSWDQIWANVISITNLLPFFSSLNASLPEKAAVSGQIRTRLDPSGKTLFYVFILANVKMDQTQARNFWDSLYPNTREYWRQSSENILRSQQEAIAEHFLWQSEEPARTHCRHIRAILQSAGRDGEGNWFAGPKQFSQEVFIQEILDISKAASDCYSQARAIISDATVRDKGWMQLEVSFGKAEEFGYSVAEKLFRYWALAVKNARSEKIDEDVLAAVDQTWSRLTDDEKGHWNSAAGALKEAIEIGAKRDAPAHFDIEVDEHGHLEKAKKALQLL